MKKVIRVVLITLLFLTAVNALVAGALFMISPDGSAMGMSTAYLVHSPFSTFFIPGLVLFTVNGLLNVFAAVAVIRRTSYYPRLVLLQGLLLCGWIAVQVVLVRDLNLLHIVMFSIGSLIFACGMYFHKASHIPS